MEDVFIWWRHHVIKFHKRLEYWCPKNAIDFRFDVDLKANRKLKVYPDMHGYNLDCTTFTTAGRENKSCLYFLWIYLLGVIDWPVVLQRPWLVSWWRHQMEKISALLALCAGNSPVSGEFPTQRPVTRSFDVFFDLRVNKRLSNHSWGWWFETLSRSLWRHRNVIPMNHLVFRSILNNPGCHCGFGRCAMWR